MCLPGHLHPNQAASIPLPKIHREGSHSPGRYIGPKQNIISTKADIQLDLLFITVKIREKILYHKERENLQTLIHKRERFQNIKRKQSNTIPIVLVNYKTQTDYTLLTTHSKPN